MKCRLRGARWHAAGARQLMAQHNDPGPVLLFCTTDSVVPITRTFFDAHMRNGVLERLLGFAMDDGLTTSYASRTACGAYTIFRMLKIDSCSLSHLLQWMRVGFVSEAYRDMAYNVSIRLGGFSRIDDLMRAHATVLKNKRRR